LIKNAKKSEFIQLFDSTALYHENKTFSLQINSYVYN